MTDYYRILPFFATQPLQAASEVLNRYLRWAVDNHEQVNVAAYVYWLKANVNEVTAHLLSSGSPV